MHLYNSTQPTQIVDCFDRHNIVQVQQRFQKVNAERLERARSLLYGRQNMFLDALALLFHCNHPMLPGFVSHGTPCGVSGFRPTKADLNKGKSLARSFCLTAQGHNEDIWSIFIMGSAGTLAQNQKSDFDVWLCHKPSLSTVALKELAEKCERITQWAASMRIEAHFFLMDSEAFLRGEQAELDEEASGSAQRYLLLDEFYRTAIHVAGRMPAWWFVPPNKEAEYHDCLNRLESHRFLRPNSVIDFGSASNIPIGEFLGAGIWQLYKAINSPHKSVLKLLLMESYIHQSDTPRPLSYYFKSNIYEGDFQIDNLDPYLMAYNKIEEYLLSTGDVERLDIARRCLYFKINKPLSRERKHSDDWQREVIKRLVRHWHWSDDYVAILDARLSWSVLAVKQERNQLVNTLNHSYNALSAFAKRHEVELHISSTELTVLGRKLQAAFEKRPGKIDWINPDISNDISESHLILTSFPHPNGAATHGHTWQLFGLESGADTPLKQSNSLVELLFWCYCNKVIENNLSWDLNQVSGITQIQLQRMLSGMQRWAPKPDANPKADAFKHPAMPTSVLVVANACAKDDSYLDGDVLRLSDATDAFNYGSFNENLITSIDLIIKNSWNEYSCTHHVGAGTLLDTLEKLFSLCIPGSHQAPPTIEVDCVDERHGPLIAKRIRQWLNEIMTCYYSGTKPASSRYIFRVSKKFYSLQFKGPRILSSQHDSRGQLVKYLGESQHRYSPVVLDSFTFNDDILSVACRRMSARSVQVFFQQISSQIEMYVFDERGSLTHSSGDFTPEFNALYAMHKFLRSVMARIPHLRKSDHASHFGVFPIEFYQVHRDKKHQLTLSPKTISPEVRDNDVMPVKAVIHTDENNHFAYNFYCDNQQFLWQEHQNKVFRLLVQYIMTKRSKSESYPMFITDLDLEGCKQQIAASDHLQISHYLRVKVELERKLNQSAG